MGHAIRALPRTHAREEGRTRKGPASRRAHCFLPSARVRSGREVARVDLIRPDTGQIDYAASREHQQRVAVLSRGDRVGLAAEADPVPLSLVEAQDQIAPGIRIEVVEVRSKSANQEVLSCSANQRIGILAAVESIISLIPKYNIGTLVAIDQIFTQIAVQNIISFSAKDTVIALAAKLSVVPSPTGEEILSEIAVDKVGTIPTGEAVIARIAKEGIVSSIAGTKVFS